MSHHHSKTLVKGLAVAAIAAVAEAIVASSAHALTITQYTFGPDGSAPISTPTTTAAGTNSSSLSGGSGGAFYLTNFGGENYVNYLSGSTSPTDAVANNSFITFDVAPTTGNQLNLNFLSLVARDSSSPPSMSIFLRSSLDNFTSDIGATQAVTTSYPTFSSYNFSLTAPAYQKLSSPVTFRLYVFSPNQTTYSYDFDTVTLDGTATPVPFAFSPLPGLVFAWGARVARRKQQKSLVKAKA